VTPLTISQIGRRVGHRPSAIRYYERSGILQPPPRVAGQRRHDQSPLYRLTVIQRARTLSVTLREIRALAVANWISRRWSELTRITLYVTTFGLAIGSIFVYGLGASRMRIGKSAFIFVITAPISWLIAAVTLTTAALISWRRSRHHVS
jgi:hypothetical protein